MEPATVTIRVAGLGHKLTLEGLPASTTTVDDLRARIHEATGVAPRYQKLVGPRRLVLDYRDGESEQHHCALEGGTSLSGAGIVGRTKLLLLHSGLYAAEKDAREALEAIEGEIDALEASIRGGSAATKKAGFVAEMVTRLCCKLDAVDPRGSGAMRAKRKELIQRAEGLEALADASKC